MRVDIVLTAAEAARADMNGKSVIVIDVLRATTVMIEALVNGAGKIIPVSTIDEARGVRESLSEPAILAGERHAGIIEGFDAGNSPLSFTHDFVEGKTIVQTTTNGTQAISLALENLSSYGDGHEDTRALPVYIGAFVNFTAVARTVAARGKNTLIVCAGRKGSFTMEDGLCAGAIASVLTSCHGYSTSDIAMAMTSLYEDHREDMTRLMAGTAHYRNLVELGYGADIDFCMRRDIYTAVPCLYDDGAVRLG